jgi:2-oxoisovalerate dehydrogenase E1 component alpha subunit
VQGGDAGTAEGDFATCLIWSSRPNNELPLLMIVANNGWGISTPESEQHGEKHIADRGKAFGIKTAVIDGNDAEVAYRELRDAMDYVRAERRPFLLEAKVSRLYGHSSASGANFVSDEVDCLPLFEKKLESRGVLTRAQMDELRAKVTEELLDLSKRVRDEPEPKGESIWEHVFAEQDLVHEGAAAARARGSDRVNGGRGGGGAPPNQNGKH